MDKKTADRIVVLLMVISRSIYSPDTVYAITNEIRNLIDPYTRNTGAIITDGTWCNSNCPFFHRCARRCTYYGLPLGMETPEPYLDIFYACDPCKAAFYGRNHK